MKTAIPAIALIVLSCALAWAVFFKGGVWPDQWAVSLALIGAAACLAAFCAKHEAGSARPLNAWLRWLLVLLPLYIGLTLIPLPNGVLDRISPGRGALLRQLQPVMPGAAFAPLSVNPAATVLALFTLIGYIVAFFAVREIALSLRRPWLTALPLVCIGGCEAALGLVQQFANGTNSAAAGTYANRDHFAGLVEMVLPLALLSGCAAYAKKSHGAVQTKWLTVACILWSVAALLFAAILYSLSRMGFLVALFTFFLIPILVFGGRVRSSRSRWLIVAGAATAVVVACVLFTPDQLAGRFAALSSKESASTEIRTSIWSETLPLIGDFKLFGCGLGGFPSAFLKHQAIANGYAVEFAHNDYLQYLAELGIVGFLLIAAAIALLVRHLAIALRSSRSKSDRLFMIACAASLAGMALHSFVDFNTYIPANALTLAWIGGMASAISAE